jgi:hypothetical protein
VGPITFSAAAAEETTGRQSYESDRLEPITEKGQDGAAPDRSWKLALASFGVEPADLS